MFFNLKSTYSFQLFSSLKPFFSYPKGAYSIVNNNKNQPNSNLQNN